MILPVVLWACLSRPARADDDAAPSPEMRRELERAERSNLENAAAAAAGESERALRNIRAIVLSAEADLDGARAEVENLLRDPAEVRRQLGAADADPVDEVQERHDDLSASGQILAAKLDDFLVKAGSVPLEVPVEDPARLLNARAAYRAADREADLKRARADAASAAERLGVAEPWPEAASALSSLSDCAAELDDSARLVRETAALLARHGRRDTLGGSRDALLEREKALEAGARDLARESELLRSDFLLQKADRQITGRIR